MAKFEKVSFEQFKKDWLETFGSEYHELDEKTIENNILGIYNNIILPKRATSGSAGYDFFCPKSLTINTNESIKIPTGIRCKIIYDGWVLKMYPRSGHGFKTGIHMANTVGIIDEDYYGANNEGHIFVKLVNDSSLAKPIEIKIGDAFCQGVFTPYGITTDDDITMARHGGLGSTSK